MASLLDGIKGMVTNEIISAAASSLGESESGISKAIGGLAPTILSGILGKSGDANAMGSIFNMLSDKKNASFLDNLGGLIGGGNLAHGDPKDAAGHLMGSLFGSKVPAILSALSSFAGIKSSSASSLMGLVGPLVMGYLSRKINAEGLNVGSFLKLLQGEKSSIQSALPSGLSSVMGFADMGGNTPNIQEATRHVEASGNKWLWPLLALLGLGLGLWYFTKDGCSKPKVEMPTVPVVNTDSIKAAADALAAQAAAAAANFTKKLAGGFEILGAKDGIESQLITFVEGTAPVDKTTWFNFDHLNFKTGSADLDMDYSKAQLTNIYEIMKAFPALKLKVGGYTDNVGNPAANMKLSAARATNVVAALTAMGVEKGRLEAEGYGEQHPICPANDTDECKAKNRRIAVRVTAK